MAAKKDDPAATADAATETMQATADEVSDKGFHGERTDDTPLENYTLPGVLAGKPTPETPAPE